MYGHVDDVLRGADDVDGVHYYYVLTAGLTVEDIGGVC